MRFVLSGAAGFIGSHLTDRLLEENHEVVGLDNLLTGSARNLAHLQGHPRFRFVRQDVTQPVDIDGSIDGVLHLASPASPKDYLEHPIETLEVGSAGPRMKLNDGRVAPAFLDQVLRGVPITVFGDGSQTRSFCYVSDLGDPRELTIREFAEQIQRLAGTELPIEYSPLPEDDPKRRRPDISKARRVLGWEPRVPLEEGLRKTIVYLRSLCEH